MLEPSERKTRLDLFLGGWGTLQAKTQIPGCVIHMFTVAGFRALKHVQYIVGFKNLIGYMMYQSSGGRHPSCSGERRKKSAGHLST